MCCWARQRHTTCSPRSPAQILSKREHRASCRNETSSSRRGHIIYLPWYVRSTQERFQISLVVGKYVSDCGRFSTIWHVDHVDAGHHLEELAREVGYTSIAARRHVDFARIGLGIGDELGNCLDWNR